MKSPRFKTSEKTLQKMLAEAMVDSYGEYEQFAAVVVTLEDNLPFPFEAKVIGETVEVTGIDSDHSELGRGVIAKVRRNSKEFRVALSELELPGNFKGRRWLELYEYYLREF